MSLNVATILREAVAQHPDKPCLLVDGISVTYADVERGSARAAAGLLALGLVRGDMVAVQLENSADFVFCYFGILRAGLTMVPAEPAPAGAGGPARDDRLRCQSAPDQQLTGGRGRACRR